MCADPHTLLLRTRTLHAAHQHADSGVWYEGTGMGRKLNLGMRKKAPAKPEVVEEPPIEASDEASML